MSPAQYCFTVWNHGLKHHSIHFLMSNWLIVAVYNDTEDFNDKRMQPRIHDVLSYPCEPANAAPPRLPTNVPVSPALEDFMSKWDHAYSLPPPKLYTTGFSPDVLKPKLCECGYYCNVLMDGFGFGSTVWFPSVLWCCGALPLLVCNTLVKLSSAVSFFLSTQPCISIFHAHDIPYCMYFLAVVYVISLSLLIFTMHISP